MSIIDIAFLIIKFVCGAVVALLIFVIFIGLVSLVWITCREVGRAVGKVIPPLLVWSWVPAGFITGWAGLVVLTYEWPSSVNHVHWLAQRGVSREVVGVILLVGGFILLCHVLRFIGDGGIGMLWRQLRGRPA